MLLLPLFVFSSCREDYGTEPGNDKSPMVTVYQYAPGKGYNADNDLRFRVLTNAAVKETFYLVELKKDKEARKLNESQYAEYVVKNGTKIDVKASSSKDVFVKGLKGIYAVTIVSVNGGTRVSKSLEFFGLDYKPFGKGKYQSVLKKAPFPAELEYSEVGNRYRIANVWKEGYHMTFTMEGNKIILVPSDFPLGVAHPQYGAFNFKDKGSVYLKDKKIYVFNVELYTPAGSLGDMQETFFLD